MYKFKIFGLVLLSIIVAGCAGKIPEGGFKLFPSHSTIQIVPVAGESITKQLGQVAIKLEPAKKTYDYLHASDNFITWRFTVTNNCKRVYNINESTLGIKVNGSTVDVTDLYKKGFYDTNSWMINRNVYDLKATPGQTMSVQKSLVWSYDLSVGYPATIQIALYNVPKCTDAEIGGHENIVWNYTYHNVQ